MIAKFEKVCSIGKFRDYSASGDVSFKEFTLIYADNGSGKTTLAAILRSLLTGDESIIRKRLSDSATVDQAVILTTFDPAGGKANISFGKAGWKKPYSNMEIFDTRFVHENIHSGFEISDDHKKNLHQFVIGAQGVKVKNNILKNKTAKEAARKKLAEICSSLQLKVGNGLTEEGIKDFVKLKKDDAVDIDKKVKKAEQALATAQAQKTILRYPELPKVDQWTTEINFDQLIADMQTASTNLQDKALAKFFEEKTQELSVAIADPEDWLKTGFGYVNHKTELDSVDLSEVNCPFCSQNLSTDLRAIKSYMQLFDDEFKAYVSRLNRHLTRTGKLKLEVLISEKDAVKRTVAERFEFWKSYIGIDEPKISVVTNSKKLKSEFEAMQESINKKCKNASISKKTDDIKTFRSSFTEVKNNIDRTNRNIENYNKEIRAFKLTIKNQAAAEKELHTLLRTKKRFDPEIEKLCSDYSAVARELKTLEDDYTALSKEEGKEANTFITNYSKKINYYLKDVFMTPFLIDAMQHGSRKGKGKEAKVEYTLLLNGKPMSFDGDDAFNVSDCLSEGDKSTIAFSFFLSKLQIDSKMADKILIFDDPLSSLDSNRRYKTVQLIDDISKSIKQTVVLSHNEGFLWELYKDYDSGKRKALRIVEDMLDGGAVIEHLDLEYLVEHEYFKHIKKVENWLKRPDISQKEHVIGLIRNILESHIKFKFYRQLKALGLSKQTFGNCIEELVSLATPFRNNADRKQIIQDLRMLNAISCRPHHGGTLPNPKDFGVDPTKITNTELGNFIKRTFELIDKDI